MVAPAILDISFPQGDTFTYSLALFSDSTGTVPKPLTGLSGKLQARFSPYSPCVQMELTDTNGGLIFQQISTGNTVSNCITILVPSSVSASLPIDFPMSYSLEITEATGEKHTYVAGNCTVLGNSTQ
jgi:hypothetical protein